MFIRPVSCKLSFFSAITQNVCQLESLSVECAFDAIIVVTSARYGRMRLSRCADTDYGAIGCRSDVRYLLERKCAGRRRCSFPVPNNDLEATRPCPVDLKSYLEFSFLCIPGETNILYLSHTHTNPMIQKF